MKKLTQKHKTTNSKKSLTTQIRTYLFLIVTFILFGLQYGNAQATFSIVMHDSACNGWGSNSIRVQLNGVTIFGGAKVLSGCSREIYFTAYHGDRLTTLFSQLGGEDVMTYEIEDNSGHVVAHGTETIDLDIYLEYACAYSQDFGVSNIMPTSFEITFAKKIGYTDNSEFIDIELVTAGSTRTGIPTHSFIANGTKIVGLIPDTLYDLYYKPYCDDIFRYPSVYLTFKTPPIEPYYNLPILHNFDLPGNTPWPYMPGVHYYTTGDQYLYTYEFTTKRVKGARFFDFMNDDTNSNSYSLPLSIDYDENEGFTSAESWVFTPDFELEENHKYKVSFCNVSDVDNMEVYLSRSARDSFYSGMLLSTIDPHNYCSTYNASFEATDTDYYHLAIRFTGNDHYSGASLDNFYIREVSSGTYCGQVGNCETINIEDDTATIQWEEDAEITPESYTVRYGIEGFDFDNDGTDITDLTNTSLDLTGLKATTIYQWFVKTQCTSTTEGDWIGPFYFTTSCKDSYTAGYRQYFDDTLSPEIDPCWSKLGVDRMIENYDYSYYPALSGDSQIIFSILDDVEEAVLVSPMFNDFDSTKLIEFYLKGPDDNVSLEIGTLSDPTDITTFTTFTTISAASISDSNWNRHEVNFSTYTGTDKYIGFKSITELTGNNYVSLFMDNFIYNVGNPCASPAFLSVTNETNVGAELSWQERGSATVWDVYITYDRGGDNIDPRYTNITPEASLNDISNPFVWTNAVADENYVFYVRSDCSGDNSDTSYWEGPFPFHTLPTCEEPSSLHKTNITSTGADLSWAENGTATNWDILIKPIVDGMQTPTKDTPPTVDNISSTSYTWNNGDELTRYLYYVRSDCSGDNSDVSTWSFSSFKTLEHCPRPLYINATNITNTSAELYWRNNGSATNWDIEIGIAGFTPTGIPTDNNITNPFIETGLLAGTSYDYYVRSDCSGDNSTTSVWVGPYRFSTLASCPKPIGLSVSNITSLGADLSWTELGNANLWDIEVVENNTSPTGIPTNENVSNAFTWNNGIEETRYDYYVRSDCSGDNSDISIWVGPYTFTTMSSTCDICSSEGTTQYQTSTTLVQIGSINNASGKTKYSDYTSMNTNVNKLSSYDLVIQVNTDGNYLANTIVWIDWNQNCSFENPGEEYILGTALNVSDGTISNSPLSITIPDNAFLGSTTMRISTKSGSIPATSCQTGFDGEVEDYTLTILEANLCPAPTNLTTSNTTFLGADLIWTENGTATQWI